MAEATRTGVITKIKKRLEDSAPLLDEWANILLQDVRLGFESQTDPNDNTWTPLSPSTRKRVNTNPDEILIDSGELFASIDSMIEGNEAIVGPTRFREDLYIHQFGGSTGPQFPNEIPQRAYVGASDNAVLDIRRAYMNYWFGNL